MALLQPHFSNSTTHRKSRKTFKVKWYFQIVKIQSTKIDCNTVVNIKISSYARYHETCKKHKKPYPLTLQPLKRRIAKTFIYFRCLQRFLSIGRLFPIDFNKMRGCIEGCLEAAFRYFGQNDENRQNGLIKFKAINCISLVTIYYSQRKFNMCVFFEEN